MLRLDCTIAWWVPQSPTPSPMYIPGRDVYDSSWTGHNSQKKWKNVWNDNLNVSVPFLTSVNVHSSDCSESSCMRAAAAVAVSLFGLTLNSGTAGLSVELSWEHVSSKGYRCWTAGSRISLLVFSLAALTISSLPLMRWVTTASFHWFHFFLSSWVMMTSPTCGWGVCFSPAPRWLSRWLQTYSAVHRLFPRDFFTLEQKFGSFP